MSEEIMVSRRGPTSKPVVLIAFASLIFSFGLVLDNYLIFATIPIVMYLALVYIQSDTLQPKVKVVRSIERTQIDEDETTQVRLRVTNLGKQRIPFLRLIDKVPQDVFDEKLTITKFNFSLEAGETKDFFYVLKGKSFGLYNLGPARLKCEDANGFSTVEFEFGHLSDFVVLPRATQKLTHFKIGPRRTKPWPGEISSRRIGLGLDNYSIRQFVSGDSYRRVNWRASARSSEEQLLLNEQKAELGADTMILVDARPISNVGSKTDSTVTSSIHAAISISDKLLKDRNRVGLITVGSFTDRIQPGFGRRQFDRLVMSLIRVRPGEFATFENIARYLRFYYSNLTQVILVSPMTDYESFAAAAEMSRLGYELIVVSPNPLDYRSTTVARSFRKSPRVETISVELAQLIRKANIMQLRKIHIAVVDWRKNEPLDHALTKTMRAWGRQMELQRGSRS
jgi:uncharacterized protein (DUF58 family)